MNSSEQQATTFSEDEADILMLLDALNDTKLRIKSLQEKEASLKEDLMELLKSNSIEDAESDKGKVRIQYRNEKDYGPVIRAKEQELKEDKALADAMGDYTIIGTKETLVFTLPKD